MEPNSKPDWAHWNACETLAVWEAVSLGIGREPATVPDRSRKLVNSSTHQPRNLFDGGPEYDRRLDLLRRAFELDPSRFLLPNDCYAGFDPLERRAVLPTKVRQFFVEKGLAVPAEWVAPATTESKHRLAKPGHALSTSADEQWKQRAQDLFREMRPAHPSWNKERFADKIADQLANEGFKGRGGKQLSGAYILRHALQNIR